MILFNIKRYATLSNFNLLHRFKTRLLFLFCTSHFVFIYKVYIYFLYYLVDSPFEGIYIYTIKSNSIIINKFTLFTFH
jgi:hypothetical protein